MNACLGVDAPGRGGNGVRQEGLVYPRNMSYCKRLSDIRLHHVSLSLFDCNAGVTCLMGIADCPVEVQGISFPSSHTTGFHSCYFPTGPNGQGFQVHWPIPVDEANSGNWGNLTDVMSKKECRELARRLEKDGWHERYFDPLCRVTHAVRVGFALMNPRLKQWAYGKNKRVVLVGDAAHPPVPYM